MTDERPILAEGERYTTHLDPLQRGGGEKFQPQSIDQTRTNLLPQARALSLRSHQLPDELRGPRTVFYATLLPNFLANGYFPGRLIRELDLVPLGSRRSVGTLRTRTRTTEGVPTKTLILAGSEHSFDELISILASDLLATSLRQAREDLREFSELRLPETGDVVPGLEQVLEAGERRMFEAVFHPDPAGEGVGRRPIDPDTYAKWERLVDRFEGEVLSAYRRTVGGLTFVPVVLAADLVPEVAAFNPLRALRPMPVLRPVPQILRSGAAAPTPHASQTRAARREPIAVFDGGTDATSAYFSPFVQVTDLTGLPAEQDPLLHGSLVTSALLYGHIEDGGALPIPPAPVDHFRVFPLGNPGNDPDAYEVLDRITATVRDHRYDIVSLSVGPDEAVEDGEEPTRWTAELDALAYEHGVLFVSAAGNNGLRDQATGLNRVQPPGDMVNGLAIGASDVPEPEAPWDRTAYSAIGPGRPGATVQPVGIAFGGVDQVRPFKGVYGNGGRLALAGTSFSAPTIARSLADLAGRIGRLADANTLRAFAAHFAVNCDPPRQIEVGHGRLHEDYADVLECEPNAVTVLFRGTAQRGQVDRLRLPYPDGVVDRGIVDIRWTLAFASPTDPTEAAEYTKAGLDLLFRPHASIHSLTLNGRTSKVDMRRDVDVDLVREALSRGGNLSTHPRTEAGRGGPETQRREDGKWETIRRQAVRMYARRVFQPTLDVVYYARDGGVLVTDAPPIPYSLLVTIEAPAGVDLYDRAQAEFRLLTPVRVQARAAVRVPSA